MSDVRWAGGQMLSPSAAARVDDVCNRFEATWKAGQRPRIEDNLAEVPEAERTVLLGELVLLDVEYPRLHPETIPKR